MKYKLVRPAIEKKFKPYSIILTIESEEEHIHFHDNVMGFLTKVNSHKFHADIFKMGGGEIEEASGKI